MRGRNDFFYGQLLSTPTPFSSRGPGKGNTLQGLRSCLPCPQLLSANQFTCVSDCRSPVPEASEPGSPALCPVTAAVEPVVGWHLWLRHPGPLSFISGTFLGIDIPGPEQLEVWASLSVESSHGLS